MQALSVTWRKFANNISKSSPMSSRFKRIVRIAFSDKYLLYTNMTISVTLSSVGDVLEQGYEIYTKDLDKYNPKRTMHMAFSGAAVGVLCHHWYKVLDKFIIGKTLEMVTKKLLLDQLIFSPVMLVTFFGSLAIFEQDPIQNFKDEVKGKFGKLYTAEWLVWPPAQVINFFFLPTRFRVLYDNTISLGYDVYTSQVKHSKSNSPPLIKSEISS
ncbi:mpv17-like protein 2 [Pectinophora gossypiella]|uniref:mpv17-like protein 2 n=1 Tax=Pectinophora gossypiella TaxID=13191 RepID=UPI00214E3F9E|nr:mpv17-like protein 2 [Pectinophora gossypiella]XP_049874340.1 mpv17-like protein 2 [Pectinophora gossypiella]